VDNVAVERYALQLRTVDDSGYRPCHRLEACLYHHTDEAISLKNFGPLLDGDSHHTVDNREALLKSLAEKPLSSTDTRE
jgi:hypothetical protein